MKVQVQATNIEYLCISGTYNNQYMVLDTNQIELNTVIHDDALWVIEQIPGLVMAADQTPILRTGMYNLYHIIFHYVNVKYYVGSYTHFYSSKKVN